MVYLALVYLSLLSVLAACHQGVDASSPAAQARAATAFAVCSIDCTFDFAALERERVDVAQTHCRNAEPECLTFYGALTPYAKARLAAVKAKLAETRFDSYGCGGCVDGNDYEVIADTLGASRYTYGTQFEHDLPPAGREAHAMFVEIVTAMRTCKDTRWVDVDDDCMARDDLTPRPYLRP